MRKFFKSIKYALKGLREVFLCELNFRIEILAALLVILLMVLLPLSTWEYILLIVMIAGVLVLEVINSIFERISDALKPRLHPMVRDVKDMMAGAVLLTSVTAAIVGTIIFWSYLKDIISPFL